MRTFLKWGLLAVVTCAGIFLLSNINHLFLTEEPDRLNLEVWSGIDPEGLASEFPGTAVVSAQDKEVLLSVPYGRVEEYKRLAEQVRVVTSAEGIPLEHAVISFLNYGANMGHQLHNYLNGDLGTIHGAGGTFEIPITEAMKGMLARSLTYFIPGLLLGLGAAFISSLFASFRRSAGRMLDSIHALLVGIPDFFLVTLLTLASIYCYKLTGQRLFHVAAAGGVVPFMLPLLTIAVVPGVLIYGTLRLAIDRELSQDYVVTAKAKGLSQTEVLLFHVLRNIALDLLAVMPKATNLALASMVVAEAFCDILGLGGIIVSPKLHGITAMTATCFALAVISILLHAVYATLRQRLIVRTKGA